MTTKTASKTFKQQVEAFEQDLIENALRDFFGNISDAAFYLGMNRTTLVEKMKKYRTRNHMDRELKNIRHWLMWRD